MNSAKFGSVSHQGSGDLISPMNHCLADLERQAVDACEAKSRIPLVFFCFPPRSGSTLMAQCLARTGRFAYISNLTARFWGAPVLGMQLEKEIGLRSALPASGRWCSDYGRTEHPAEPHEFGYFWNQFVTREHHRIIEKDLPVGDMEFLVRQVAAMQSVSGEPFFFKNSIAGYNADLLAKWFPNAFFIFIRREPAFVAQSILKAREAIAGSANEWWSLKPEEFLLIQERSRDQYDEIAMQVLSIQRRQDRHMLSLGSQSVSWDYAEFCRGPREHIRSLGAITGVDMSDAVVGKIPASFDVSSRKTVSLGEFERLERALSDVELPSSEAECDE